MSNRKATLISNPKTGRYASRRRSVHELVSQFDSALKAERMKTALFEYEMAEKTLKLSLLSFNGKEETPGCKLFKQQISEIQKANIIL